MRHPQNLSLRCLVALGLFCATPAFVRAQAPAATPAVSNDPIAVAVRESNPSSPRQLAQAIQILLDARLWNDCKQYVQQFSALGADDQTLADVHREFGPALFLRLTRTTELAPEGAALAESVLSAARRVAEDPARIDRLIGELADPATRTRATIGLRESGVAAVPRLLKVLADEAQTDLHRPVQSTLLALRDQSVDPLLAALEAENAAFLVRVSEVLVSMRDLGTVTAVVPLVYRQDLDEASRQHVERLLQAAGVPVGSRAEVEQFLTGRFRSLFRQDPSKISVDSQEFPRWVWDAAQQTVVQRPLTDAASVRWRCLRAANDLVRIHPEHPQAQIWSLAAQLEWDQALTGVEEPLPADHASSVALRTAGPSAAIEVLDLALEMGRSAAAVASAGVLADIGSYDQVRLPSGAESPLIMALRSPNQHVQYAAAAAIMRINPDKEFPGSARFRDTLGFFLASAGQRRALVGNPKIDEAQTWASWVREMGYEVDVALNGNEVLSRLQANPDYEFVVLVDTLHRPDVRELVQLIRAIPGYAQVRCAILAHAWNYERLEEHADDQPGLAVFPRPHSVESVRFVLNGIQQMPGQRPASPETRAARGATVLDWLAAAAAAADAERYDLLRLEDQILPLLIDSPLATRAAKVLGGMATAKSQRRLVDVASVTSFPLELREACAAAFTAAVQKRGVMLTTGEILQQYDRYNASERLDADTQRVLGSILDAIEGPSRGNQP